LRLRTLARNSRPTVLLDNFEQQRAAFAEPPGGHACHKLSGPPLEHIRVGLWQNGQRAAIAESNAAYHCLAARYSVSDGLAFAGAALIPSSRRFRRTEFWIPPIVAASTAVHEFPAESL
jgi:hypothetical protein